MFMRQRFRHNIVIVFQLLVSIPGSVIHNCSVMETCVCMCGGGWRLLITIHGIVIENGHEVSIMLLSRLQACSKSHTVPSGVVLTVLYRDYAHPYCMLQSSYRWDGLNFENSSFASELSPPRCLPRNYAHS